MKSVQDSQKCVAHTEHFAKIFNDIEEIKRDNVGRDSDSRSLSIKIDGIGAGVSRIESMLIGKGIGVNV